nr:small heat shock protein [Polygordius sp. ID7]
MAPQITTQPANNARVVTGRDGTRLLQLKVALTGINQQDLAVRPVDSTLVILRNEEVLQTVELPESVDPFTVEAKMTKDGFLTVEALLMG